MAKITDPLSIHYATEFFLSRSRDNLGRVSPQAVKWTALLVLRLFLFPFQALAVMGAFFIGLAVLWAVVFVFVGWAAKEGFVSGRQIIRKALGLSGDTGNAAVALANREARELTRAAKIGPRLLLSKARAKPTRRL